MGPCEKNSAIATVVLLCVLALISNFKGASATVAARNTQTPTLPKIFHDSQQYGTQSAVDLQHLPNANSQYRMCAKSELNRKYTTFSCGTKVQSTMSDTCVMKCASAAQTRAVSIVSLKLKKAQPQDSTFRLGSMGLHATSSSTQETEFFFFTDGKIYIKIFINGKNEHQVDMYDLNLMEMSDVSLFMGNEEIAKFTRNQPGENYQIFLSNSHLTPIISSPQSFSRSKVVQVYHDWVLCDAKLQSSLLFVVLDKFGATTSGIESALFNLEPKVESARNLSSIIYISKQRALQKTKEAGLLINQQLRKCKPRAFNFKDAPVSTGSQISSPLLSSVLKNLGGIDASELENAIYNFAYASYFIEQVFASDLTDSQTSFIRNAVQKSQSLLIQSVITKCTVENSIDEDLKKNADELLQTLATMTAHYQGKMTTLFKAIIEKLVPEEQNRKIQVLDACKSKFSNDVECDDFDTKITQLDDTSAEIAKSTVLTPAEMEKTVQLIFQKEERLNKVVELMSASVTVRLNLEHIPEMIDVLELQQKSMFNYNILDRSTLLPDFTNIIAKIEKIKKQCQAQEQSLFFQKFKNLNLKSGAAFKETLQLIKEDVELIQVNKGLTVKQIENNDSLANFQSLENFVESLDDLSKKCLKTRVVRSIEKTSENLQKAEKLETIMSRLMRNLDIIKHVMRNLKPNTQLEKDTATHIMMQCDDARKNLNTSMNSLNESKNPQGERRSIRNNLLRGRAVISNALSFIDEINKSRSIEDTIKVSLALYTNLKQFRDSIRAQLQENGAQLLNNDEDNSSPSNSPKSVLEIEKSKEFLQSSIADMENKIQTSQSAAKDLECESNGDFADDNIQNMYRYLLKSYDPTVASRKNKQIINLINPGEKCAANLDMAKAEIESLSNDVIEFKNSLTSLEKVSIA